MDKRSEDKAVDLVKGLRDDAKAKGEHLVTEAKDQVADRVSDQVDGTKAKVKADLGDAVKDVVGKPNVADESDSDPDYNGIDAGEDVVTDDDKEDSEEGSEEDFKEDAGEPVNKADLAEDSKVDSESDSESVVKEDAGKAGEVASGTAGGDAGGNINEDAGSSVDEDTGTEDTGNTGDTESGDAVDHVSTDSVDAVGVKESNVENEVGVNKDHEAGVADKAVSNKVKGSEVAEPNADRGFVDADPNDEHVSDSGEVKGVVEAQADDASSEPPVDSGKDSKSEDANEEYPTGEADSAKGSAIDKGVDAYGVKKSSVGTLDTETQDADSEGTGVDLVDILGFGGKLSESGVTARRKARRAKKEVAQGTGDLGVKEDVTAGKVPNVDSVVKDEEVADSTDSGQNVAQDAEAETKDADSAVGGAQVKTSNASIKDSVVEDVQADAETGVGEDTNGAEEDTDSVEDSGFDSVKPDSDQTGIPAGDPAKVLQALQEHAKQVASKRDTVAGDQSYVLKKVKHTADSLVKGDSVKVAEDQEVKPNVTNTSKSGKLSDYAKGSDAEADKADKAGKVAGVADIEVDEVKEPNTKDSGSDSVVADSGEEDEKVTDTKESEPLTADDLDKIMQAYGISDKLGVIELNEYGKAYGVDHELGLRDLDSLEDNYSESVDKGVAVLNKLMHVADTNVDKDTASAGDTAKSEVKPNSGLISADKSSVIDSELGKGVPPADEVVDTDSDNAGAEDQGAVAGDLVEDADKVADTGNVEEPDEDVVTDSDKVEPNKAVKDSSPAGHSAGTADGLDDGDDVVEDDDDFVDDDDQVDGDGVLNSDEDSTATDKVTDSTKSVVKAKDEVDKEHVAGVTEEPAKASVKKPVKDQVKDQEVVGTEPSVKGGEDVSEALATDKEELTRSVNNRRSGKTKPKKRHRGLFSWLGFGHKKQAKQADDVADLAVAPVKHERKEVAEDAVPNAMGEYEHGVKGDHVDRAKTKVVKVAKGESKIPNNRGKVKHGAEYKDGLVDDQRVSNVSMVAPNTGSAIKTVNVAPVYSRLPIKSYSNLLNLLNTKLNDINFIKGFYDVLLNEYGLRTAGFNNVAETGKYLRANLADKGLTADYPHLYFVLSAKADEGLLQDIKANYGKWTGMVYTGLAGDNNELQGVRWQYRCFICDLPRNYSVQTSFGDAQILLGKYLLKNVFDKYDISISYRVEARDELD